MSVAPTEPQAAFEVIPGHPNLRRGNPAWEGRGGNPTGVSRYQVEVRKAIEAQEPPERICQVVDAMFRDAIAGKKHSAQAAKVYAMLVGCEANDPERIIKAVKQHLDNLLREAERLEAIDQEREQAKLPPVGDE